MPFRLTPSSSTLDAAAIVLVTSLVSFHHGVMRLYSTIQSHEIDYKVSHSLFRRFEPRSALSRATLLVVTPALLTIPISYLVSPYTTLPLAFAGYWSGLVFFTLAYRLSPIHPLAKYPGPVLAKSSKFWGAYHSAIGDQHRCYKRLHDRYGDIVRIGLRQHPPSSI